MPRQDVPYGGAICRLKERIAEIWDKLGEKLHSINGVEGDAAGDVKIVSGDAAVVITSDQVNHQIEVALDSSQLPAAAVSSVNGQTGAVALDAGDIPSDGNSDVQTDIDNLKTNVNANTSAIAAEALARANADSTLQGNINTLSASIPTAAATAVANDPTVAQLSNDVATLQTADGQNVKLSGSQNITGNKTVPTEATGAYSQQIANSNKVKAELDNYPLVVRTTGTQFIGGNKSFNTFIDMTAGTTEVRIFDDVAKTNQIAAFGVRFRTGYSTNASMKSYAPKVDPSDPAEVQRGGFLQLVSNRDGTLELVIFGTNASGTLVRKSLAYFDGSVWN